MLENEKLGLNQEAEALTRLKQQLQLELSRYSELEIKVSSIMYLLIHLDWLYFKWLALASGSALVYFMCVVYLIYLCK